MKKRGLSLVELIVYVFITSFVGFFVVVLTRHFWSAIENTNLNRKFAQSHNSMIKKLYQDAYNGWNLYNSYNSGLVLVNSGYYQVYKCFSTGIALSYSLTGLNNINDYYNQTYTGFTCNGISANKYLSGYWIDFDMKVAGKGVNLKYFIYPNK